MLFRNYRARRRLTITEGHQDHTLVPAEAVPERLVRIARFPQGTIDYRLDEALGSLPSLEKVEEVVSQQDGSLGMATAEVKHRGDGADRVEPFGGKQGLDVMSSLLHR